MKIFKFFFFVMIFFVSLSCLFSSTIYNDQNYFYKSSLYLNTDLEVDYLVNRLNDGWKVYEHNIGRKFINDMTNDNTKKDYSIFGTLSLEAYLKLNDKIKAMMEVDIYTSENRSFWHSINDQNRKTYRDKEFITLKKAEINFKDYFYHFRIFKGIGHYSWKYEGDMFDFYKEQFDTDRYLNISDRTLPEGIEIDYSFGFLGDTKVVYGEAMWGQEKSVYFKHNRKIGAFSNYFLYKREKTLWDVEDKDDKYQESYALTTDLENVLPFTLSLGIMYHSFRINMPYEYEENGIKKIDFTDKKDGLGYGLKLHGRDFVPIFDYTTIETKYLGILAGNKQEYSISFDKILSKFFINFRTGYRKPLEKANPLIYYKNSEVLCLSPRGEESPFLVNDYNRELLSGDMTISYFYDKFNPNNIYIYEMGNLTSWNLDKKDNTVFSAAFNYNIKKYKGNTDLNYYTDEFDQIVWESCFLPGLLEPKYPLSTYSLFLKGKIKQNLVYNLLCTYGDSFATGSNAYIDDKFISINQFIDIDFNLYFYDFSFIFKYGKDCWGYEDWHRFFGITYDNLYKYEIYKNFGIFGDFGLSYMKVVQNKYKTEIVDIPSFEEFMLKWKYNFERIYIFKEKIKKDLDILFNDKYNYDKKDIFLISDRNSGILTLNNDMIDDKIVFDLDFYNSSNVLSWEVEILNESKNRILRKDFRGNLPRFFEWDGRSSKNLFVEDGKYEIIFKCLLENGTVLYSDKHSFYVYSYPSIMDFNSIKGIINNKDIILTNEKYEKFLFNYDLDSIYNKDKFKFKFDTLNSLLPILQKKEVNKIIIHVYSDYGDGIFTDQKKGKGISDAISKCFIDAGVSPSHIEKFSYSLRDKKVLRHYKKNMLVIECVYHIDREDSSKKIFSEDDSFEEIKKEIENTGKTTTEKLNILKEFSTKEIKLSSDILFRLGKYRLSKSGLRSVRKTANEILAAYPSDKYDVLIEGHTCDLGKAVYNERLSLKRAISVADVFKTYGLKHRFLVVGRGESSPLVPNVNEINRKKNRRIEIILIEKK